jgi:UDP-GlcNAc3NAcA epimerase
MQTRTILTVVGARPQFIKAAPLSKEIDATDGLAEILVHTGQHYDANMSDIFFEELGMSPPDYNLAIREVTHATMTARMLVGLEGIIEARKPDAVLIYGDTNSTLAGALTAAKMHIPVIHVEAGLRSYNRAMPEELNRIVADVLSDLLLAPSPEAAATLEREAVAGRVRVVGDLMYDAVLASKPIALQRSSILSRLGLTAGAYAVCTLHRAENTDDPQRLAELLTFLEQEGGGIDIVMPLHPRTRAKFEAFGLSAGRLRVIEPLGYLDMQRLMTDCVAVFTDSGGLQKEAYFHGKPCVTLREETEWTETIEAGWNRLWRQPEYVEPRRSIPHFGEGDAARACVSEILAFLLDR